MSELEQLREALADRYTVDREVGRGGMVSRWRSRTSSGARS